MFSHNLGDYLSKLIVEKLLDKKGIDINRKTNETRHLLAVGSVLGFSTINATVWGSGIISPIHYKIQLQQSQYDIRALRGPETKRILESMGHICPDIMGDPAILLPLFYHPQQAIKNKPFSIIHWMGSRNRNINNKYINKIVDIETKKWRNFIDEILSSEFVISSSLHGIIVAEAYGVPAILLKPENYEKGGNFKYDDYYYSTNRNSYKIASTIEEALKISLDIPPKFDMMREKLLASFPYDLWS